MDTDAERRLRPGKHTHQSVRSGIGENNVLPRPYLCSELWLNCIVTAKLPVNRQTKWSDDKPMRISKNRKKVATSVTSLSGRHLSGNKTGNRAATDWQHIGRLAGLGWLAWGLDSCSFVPSVALVAWRPLRQPAELGAVLIYYPAIAESKIGTLIMNGLQLWNLPKRRFQYTIWQTLNHSSCHHTPYPCATPTEMN
jgi:hypothetical protein